MEQLNSCGLCIIDGFLRDRRRAGNCWSRAFRNSFLGVRCYGPLKEEVDPSKVRKTWLSGKFSHGFFIHKFLQILICISWIAVDICSWNICIIIIYIDIHVFFSV